MLRRKMIRDIRKNLSQFVTIFLMVTIGIMAYTGIESYMDGMKRTSDKFYTENNLQDINLIGTNFSKEDIDNIKKIDNVKDAEAKISVNGTTDNDRVLLLNFIESNNISKFYVKDGIKFDKNKKGVWLDEFYAKENNIKVGDTILVKYDTIELKEEVLGLINVPDHLYDTKDDSELYPERKEFGFCYLSINEIPEDYDISYNSVMVDIDDISKRDRVKLDIEDNIKSVMAIINVEDTKSYSAYQGEIDEGKTYVGVFSGLFLFIALLSVITTMTRVVKQQRIQIGTLKALGFSNFRILLHYMGYGFYISLFAGICGLILGYYAIGKVFIDLEMAFFEIPNGTPYLALKNYIVTLLVIIGVSIITLITCRTILKENPAESLRTKIPSVKKNSLNLTTKGIFKKLNFSSKWNARDIVRNKMRTFMGIAGVVGCTMLIVCAFGMLDSMNHFVDLQFSDLYNFKYKLVLKENITSEEVNELTNKYGNKTSKSYGIEIKNGDKREANNIFVTNAEGYVRFVDKKDKFTDVNRDDGVYVTYKLASLKNYKLGDEITWHIYGSDKYYTSKIVGFNKDPQNQNVTMTRKYFESVTDIEYIPDSLYTNDNISKNTTIDNVEIIQDIKSLEDGMTNMLSMMKTMIILIIVVAVVLGSLIIYNLGILSYIEKQYQFATLKVLGFKDKQIKKIFIKQNNWIAIISIIIGLPLGYYLTDWMFKTAIEEHYDFGAWINIPTYIIAFIGTFTVSYIVSSLLARKVKSIDMVTSLKSNE